MKWFTFSLLTIVLYGAHDVLIKIYSQKVDATIASLMINSSATIILILFIAYKYSGISQGLFPTLSRNEFLGLLLAGACLGLATITFMKAFNAGGSLSIVIAIVYAGIIISCFFIGMWIFKEKVEWKQFIGIGLTLCGLYLMNFK